MRCAAARGGLPGIHWDLPACRILLAGWLAVTIGESVGFNTRCARARARARRPATVAVAAAAAARARRPAAHRVLKFQSI
jgi:hypothetical protein